MWRFGRRWFGIRVLVAFDDTYRSYREVIAASIRVLRPHLNVTATDLKDLEKKLPSLKPRVVICSREKPAGLPRRVTWVTVPLDIGPTTEITLTTLLEVIDRLDAPSPPSRPTTRQENSGGRHLHTP
jgi:hypothetical protein